MQEAPDNKIDEILKLEGIIVPKKLILTVEKKLSISCIPFLSRLIRFPTAGKYAFMMI